MAVISFGRVAFVPGVSPGDSGQRFGDALSTGWAINERVLDYVVPAGKMFVAENLLVSAYLNDQGANTVAPATTTRLGKLELVANGVILAEVPIYHPGLPQTPGGGGHGRFQQWQPDCRQPFTFDDSITLDHDLVARFTPLATSNLPVAFAFMVATDIGLRLERVVIPNNSTAEVNTTIADAGRTVRSVAFHVNVDWPLMSLLLVRVNGGVWWQGMNVHTSAATGGCAPWNVVVPLNSQTFWPGDRIVVGAHVNACVGQVVMAHLAGAEIPMAGGVTINRRLVVRR